MMTAITRREACPMIRTTRSILTVLSFVMIYGRIEAQT